MSRRKTGRITFVGAGPGDPGLLTVRAAHALRDADFLLVDPDVPVAVTEVAGPDAEVRPALGDPAAVAATLLAAAKDRARVVRLVSGDPLTADAVVAETLAVARAGVPFDLVPGVPSGVGVPAYSGVPVGSAHAVADARNEVDWSGLAAAPGTLVLTATAPADGLVLAAVPAREDPRDVLVARDGLTLAELPAGARIGTGSPRRAAQVLALGLGVEMVSIRGNVDTRLGKVTSGELDAVVLARAGLARLDRLDAVTETLDPLQVLPAPAQGALAVECRAGDPLASVLAALDHPDSRAAVAAEREQLVALEAGCLAPIGALAEVVEDDDGLEIFLRGSVTAADGSDAVRLSATGPVTDASAIGRRLAADLLADGAKSLFGSTR